MAQKEEISDIEKHKESGKYQRKSIKQIRTLIKKKAGKQAEQKQAHIVSNRNRGKAIKAETRKFYFQYKYRWDENIFSHLKSCGVFGGCSVPLDTPFTNSSGCGLTI